MNQLLNMPKQKRPDGLAGDGDCRAAALPAPGVPRRTDLVVRIEKLRIEYRSRELGSQTKLAVKDLSLGVQAGEVFGFLGPNGAGKTSTMNVLLGFVPPTSGTADIFGVNVQHTIARQRLGYLPELTYYYKFLTAEELLRFYARIFGIARAERERRIDQVLKLVELDHARKRPIKTYSKGMQQRVGLAQALINNPDLLILDEPTSGLDPLGRMKVRDIIKRLKNEGKTVFFSSHELGEVETICDRVAILHQGELRVLGRVDELAAQHQCNLEQLFLKIVGYQPETL
jgi:ABC-2 type transport system ATP-binding protein